MKKEFDNDNFEIKMNDIHSSLEFQSHVGMAKINFFTFKERLIYENKYVLNTSLKELVSDFYSKVSDKILYENLNKGKYFDLKDITFYIKDDIYEKLNIDDTTISDYLIKTIQDTTFLLMEAEQFSSSKTDFKVKKNIQKLNIYIKYKYRYKHFSSNMEEYIINNILFIGKPIINELGYYIYKKNTSQLKLVKCSDEEISRTKINFFSRISAYCNANNYLFIYEGTNMANNTFTSRFIKKSSYACYNNKFIRINLINEEIKVISMKFPKRVLHSMIFVPEKYIFVVGGKYKKEIRDVLIYKIKEDNYTYEKYPHLLPYELLEPSLIMVNNKYLFAFENSKEKFNVIKCNLSKISPFEDLKIKKVNNINQKFFGVVPDLINKDRILFLGGQFLNFENNSPKKIFEFDINENEILPTNTDYENFDFIEKTFIPIEKDNYIQMSEFKINNEYIPKIIIYCKNKQSQISNEEDNKNSIKGNFLEEGFDSVQSKSLKVIISNHSKNSNSIVPSSIDNTFE